jgi:hypothetical protein
MVQTIRWTVSLKTPSQACCLAITYQDYTDLADRIREKN